MDTTVIYTRISRDDLRDDDQDGRKAVKRQREDADKLASARGAEVVAVLEDNDTSATGGQHRDGFEKALELLDSGAATTITCDRLDRIARNSKDRARFLEVAKERGVKVWLTKGADMDGSTAVGRQMMDTLLGFAQYETELMKERMERFFQQHAAEGKPWWANRPFGYEMDGTLRPEEAALMRDAYDRVVHGETLAAISRDMPDDLHKGPSHLKQLLMSPRNIAVRTYKGEEVGRGTWEPLIDDETYWAAVSILSDPERGHGGPRSLTHLLSTVAVCGICDTPEATVVSWNSNNNRAYRCRLKAHCTRKAAQVEEHVIKATLWTLARGAGEQINETRSAHQIVQVRARRTEIQHDLDELAAAHGRGDIPLRVLLTASKEAQARLAAVDQELAALAKTDLLDGLWGYRWDDEEAQAEARARFDALPLARRQEVLRTVWDRIVLKPVKPNVAWTPASVVFHRDVPAVATWSLDADRGQEAALQVEMSGSPDLAPIHGPVFPK